jgi:hypothetical protein
MHAKMKTHFAVAIVDADRNMSERQIQKSERRKLAQAPHRSSKNQTFTAAWEW